MYTFQIQNNKKQYLEIYNGFWNSLDPSFAMSDAGNKNKGKGNGAGLAWESQSHCFADQYVKLTHTLLVQTHNIITVKEIAEQCCQL